jgi:hypothetical protein
MKKQITLPSSSRGVWDGMNVGFFPQGKKHDWKGVKYKKASGSGRDDKKKRSCVALPQASLGFIPPAP